MDRRQFLFGAVVLAVPGVLGVGAAAADETEGPYGALGPPDPNGFSLPDGFTSTLVATAGEPVGPDSYLWPVAPDGGATFADGPGWIYVANSESGPETAGASALRFAESGEVVAAYRILGGTERNCAGGATPWDTWLSCEENPVGRVWECDPFGVEQARARPAMGVFSHEAAAVDPVGERVYLTEDAPDGRLYRFTPDSYPDLSAGSLEAAVVDGAAMTWVEIPDPAATSMPTRLQAPESTPFDGGEGIVWSDGRVYFTTKGTDQVHFYEPETGAYGIVYDPANGGALNGVDNIIVEPGTGRLLVAEDHDPDGGPLELVLLTPEGDTSVLARVDHPGSELTGPAFSPDGRLLYVSSQRGGNGGGATYVISGPFGGVAAGDSAGESSQPQDLSGEHDPPETSGSSAPYLVGGGVFGLAAIGGAVAWLRVRRRPA